MRHSTYTVHVWHNKHVEMQLGLAFLKKIKGSNQKCEKVVWKTKRKKENGIFSSVWRQPGSALIWRKSGIFTMTPDRLRPKCFSLCSALQQKGPASKSQALKQRRFRQLMMKSRPCLSLQERWGWRAGGGGVVGFYSKYLYWENVDKFLMKE